MSKLTQVEFGIANLMKKIDVPDTKKKFYKKVDTVYGVLTYLDGEEDKFDKAIFQPVSKYYGQAFLYKRLDDNDLFFINYVETIDWMKKKSTVLLTKLLVDDNTFSKTIGEYYTYNELDFKFDMVTDKKIKDMLDNIGKGYDASVLNSKSDISNMYSKIKETIIGQDEQVMQILTSIFKNQKIVNSDLDNDMISKLKENIIVYGSTGTGKTEILKRISKIYDVPIVIQDSTSLSETGYVGRNISDMLNDLYLAAGSNIEKAEKGILVIDEFDKLAEKGGSKDHVSRFGVQRSLLKLLDGTEFYIDGKKFDTSKLSIVALGAFMGIAKNDDYSNVKTADFVNYGIMRELMGRFSKTIAMNPLEKEDIKRILIESNFSPLNTYKVLFETMDMDFDYDDSFVDYIADKAIALQSGARSLKTIFDNEIGSAMFRIFAGEYKSIKLTRPTGEGRAYELVAKGKEDIKKGNKR